MPMSTGNPTIPACDVPTGAYVPVQTEGGGIELRVVADKHVDIEAHQVTLAFSDGSDWTWDLDAPITCVTHGDLPR